MNWNELKNSVEAQLTEVQKNYDIVYINAGDNESNVIIDDEEKTIQIY